MRRRAAAGRPGRRRAVSTVAPVLVLPALLLGGSSVPAPVVDPASPDPRELGVNGDLPQTPRLSPRVLEGIGESAPPELPPGDLDIPGPLLAAYVGAADRIAEDDPGCRLHWSVLASIGRIESGHARGGAVDVDGTTTSAILGPRLSGGPEVAAIQDTDGGVLDGDPVWDRAVGPMQFIPSTWRKHAVDDNGDQRRDPHNVHDATAAAGKYLCAGRGGLDDRENLARAVFSYNHSASYVRTVLLWADAYARGVTPSPAEIGPEVDDVLAGARLPDVPPMPEPPPLEIPEPQALGIPAEPPPPEPEPLPPVDPLPLEVGPPPAAPPEPPPSGPPEPQPDPDVRAPHPTPPILPSEPPEPAAPTSPTPPSPRPPSVEPAESSSPPPTSTSPTSTSPTSPPTSPSGHVPPRECAVVRLESGEFAVRPPASGTDLPPGATDPAEARPGLRVFTDDGGCLVPLRW